jgi:hypothetical protein
MELRVQLAVTVAAELVVVYLPTELTAQQTPVAVAVDQDKMELAAMAVQAS